MSIIVLSVISLSTTAAGGGGGGGVDYAPAHPVQSKAPAFVLTHVPEADPTGAKYEAAIQNLFPFEFGGEHQSLHEPFVTSLASAPPPVRQAGAKHPEGHDVEATPSIKVP